jgi:hypothetical protein
MMGAKCAQNLARKAVEHLHQSISITAWMASTPDLLLATNFKVPKVLYPLPNGETVMPEQGCRPNRRNQTLVFCVLAVPG